MSRRRDIEFNLEDVRIVAVVDGDEIEVVGIQIVESIDDIIEFFANEIVDCVFGEYKRVDEETLEKLSDKDLLANVSYDEYWAPEFIPRQLVGKTRFSFKESLALHELYRQFLEKYGKEVVKLAREKILKKIRGE